MNAEELVPASSVEITLPNTRAAHRLIDLLHQAQLRQLPKAVNE